jgi:hypothetical protein
MGYSEIEAITLRDVYLDRLKLPGVSHDFHLRRIFREYSQTFHTPLHVVYELPLDFVFQAWLEEYYEKQKDADLRTEAIAMTKDPAVLAEERRREDEQDADTYLFILEERKLQENMKKMEQVVQKLKQTMPFVAPDREVPIATVPVKPKRPEEEITMRFEDVDFEADSFGPFERPTPEDKPVK